MEIGLPDRAGNSDQLSELHKLREKLVAGKDARVTFHTLKGESVGVPVSLMGIKAGMAALEKNYKD